MNHTLTNEATVSTQRLINRIGFWSAILTVALSLVSFGIAINTPPLSGPFCQKDCVTYPYTDAVSQVPHDYIWMVPATLLALVVVVLMVALHQWAPDNRKIFSQIGLVFTAIYAATIIINYYIQLTVMQPSLLKGETDGLVLISQYNPRGIFIALEEVAYLMLSLAFLFYAGIFTGKQRLTRAIQWLFITSAGLVVVALIGLAAAYGEDLDYRFEVVVITITWTVLIIAGVLLSILFRHEARTDLS